MLVDNLKTLYGTTYVLFAKSFGFHHNVEGNNFPQYHQFFGDFYTDIYESLDKIAEYIRTLDSYAPGSLARMLELSVLEEQTKIPRAELMFTELLADSERYTALLNECFSAADSENQQGIADFLSSRIDSMGKYSWMIRSTLKKERA